MKEKAFQTVCKIDDVPPGTSKMFLIDEMPIGVFNIDGEFFALDNRCPHAGASLAHGIVEGEIVACRIHYWRFSIRDGTYLDECRPEFDAECYRVRIAGDKVQIEV